jgi:hypothetical protein
MEYMVSDGAIGQQQSRQFTYRSLQLLVAYEKGEECTSMPCVQLVEESRYNNQKILESVTRQCLR